MHKINTDALHEQWLGGFASFATEYLTLRHGPGTVEAILSMDFAENDLFEIEVRHRFMVPNGSGALVEDFALASRCNFPFLGMVPDRIINGGGLETLPPTTFCLSSLLFASYPRNVRTGVFKRTVAGSNVLSVADREIMPSDDGEPSGHAAFAGLGVQIMKKFRSMACPTASDEQALWLANDYYISIMG
jgi:hypothetical protein